MGGTGKFNVEIGALIMRSHSDWSGYSTELLKSAGESSAGMRQVLYKISHHSGCPPFIRSPVKLELADESSQPLICELGLQLAKTLNSFLVKLAACLGPSLMRKQIAKQQVGAWCRLLGEPWYLELMKRSSSATAQDMFTFQSYPSEKIASDMDELVHIWSPRSALLPYTLINLGAALMLHLLDRVPEMKPSKRQYIECRLTLPHSPDQQAYIAEWRSSFAALEKHNQLEFIDDETLTMLRAFSGREPERAESG